MNTLRLYGQAERYDDFLENCRPSDFIAEPNHKQGSGYSGRPEPSGELQVQAQWFGGEFGREFIGTDGQWIEIVQAGHWNHGVGPDFTDCAIRVDGELRRGSIELDLHARDWETHGHGSSERFDDVVLHVFTESPCSARFFTKNSKHQQIAQLELPHFTETLGPRSRLPEAHPGRCLPVLADMQAPEVADLLDSASHYRLRQKGLRLHRMASSTSKEQAFFQAFAEVLGYSENKLAMALIAQRNPIQSLRERSSAEQEAILFGSAGFLEEYPRAEKKEPLEPESQNYVLGVWDDWWKLRPDHSPDNSRSVPWVYSNTRPGNHPHRRLAALTAGLRQWPDWSELVEQDPANVMRSMSRWARSLEHPFWQNHYTLTSGLSAKAISLLGTARVRDFVGNVLFPYFCVRDPELWESYRRLGGSTSNQKIRRAVLRLFGPDEESGKPWIKTFAAQQGLLQIYEDFCLEDASGCANCPFPEQLSQWKVDNSSTDRSLRLVHF